MYDINKCYLQEIENVLNKALYFEKETENRKNEQISILNENLINFCNQDLKRRRKQENSFVFYILYF